MVWGGAQGTRERQIDRPKVSLGQQALDAPAGTMARHAHPVVAIPVVTVVVRMRARSLSASHQLPVATRRAEYVSPALHTPPSFSPDRQRRWDGSFRISYELIWDLRDMSPISRDI